MTSTSTATPGGYDCYFIEAPPDELLCLICLCVAKDSHQHGNGGCGKVFCHSCLTKYQSDKSNCPNCHKDLTTFKDERVSSQIKALKVKCSSLDNGCEWVGELGSLEAHLQSCDYALLPCPNKCKDDDNIVNISGKDLQEHLESDCPRRQYECPHCEEKGEHKERTTTHLETCPQVKVQCPNLGCDDSIARSLVETHRSTCEYERVRCKYAEVGCEEKPRLRDLQEHEKDSQFHLDITLETVLEFKRRAISPKTIVKLLNFESNKATDDAYFSPAFYTHSNGYRMCICVYANGETDGKGTHVSVYVYLMKGHNDDSLTWPFTGTVIIELLNQLEDKNHHKKRVPFPADGKYGQRVVNGVRAATGWGYTHQYISHADLAYKPDINCQYLKDDTLVFRVSAEAPEYDKPWLEYAQ